MKAAQLRPSRLSQSVGRSWLAEPPGSAAAPKPSPYMTDIIWDLSATRSKYKDPMDDVLDLLRTILETVAVACGSLSAQLTPAPADVFLIAVPTPFRSGVDGIPQPNIDYVLAAARAIAPVLQPGNLVLLESTSPVGTTEQVALVMEVLADNIGSEEALLTYTSAAEKRL